MTRDEEIEMLNEIINAHEAELDWLRRDHMKVGLQRVIGGVIAMLTLQDRDYLSPETAQQIRHEAIELIDDLRVFASPKPPVKNDPVKGDHS